MGKFNRKALDALRNGKSADPEGVMVVVSRQALDECVERIEELEAAIRAAPHPTYWQDVADCSSDCDCWKSKALEGDDAIT